MLGKYSDTVSADDTEWGYFVRFDITKPHRNNETGTKYQPFYICLCTVFAMTSKVRKKRKNLKTNQKGGRLKKRPKIGRCSALSEYLAGLLMSYTHRWCSELEVPAGSV